MSYSPLLVSFAALVEKDLKKRQADVIEFYQPLSPSMAEIQTAVLECMEATLSEIKRSNTSVSLSHLSRFACRRTDPD